MQMTPLIGSTSKNHFNSRHVFELFSVSKKSSQDTEEQINRRQIRARKRKEKAQEKTEKDKVGILLLIYFSELSVNVCYVLGIVFFSVQKETLDRLLKKQDSKPKGTPKVFYLLIVLFGRYLIFADFSNMIFEKC